ncbi:MAG: DUF4198 domain-containing protein [Acidobacteria bacterium]|nr:DUF4198 domain-containing protein [Acidobacteriota bacterium]MCI0721733.1 DUF4198 domain-containing protein [Acidobacteriota bacterium]
MTRQSTGFLGILLLAGVVPAFSHDLYMMPEKFVMQPATQLQVVFQNGDEFPEASSPVKPERLRNTKLVWRAGTANFENIIAEATRTTAMVRVPGAGLAILTAQTIPNFIKLDPKKFRSYLEHENLTNALKWREAHGEANKPGRERYSKYVKSLIQAGKPDEYYRQRTGLTIEIIPEADPYLLRPGAMLPVQVLFRGSPAVDVAVESAWLENGKAKMETVGRTDGSGRVRIPVKAAGPHRFHAIVMERCAEPQVADWESFWASLTFEIQSGR